MKKIGMIGGLGPQSTIYYYQRIIEQFQKTYQETGFPDIVIESVDLKTCMKWITMNRWSDLAGSLARKCNNLKNAGADFGLIASNTPHKAFDQIQKQTDLKLLSIIQTTRQYIKDHHYKHPLLLGTRFTMQSDFFRDKLKMDDIDTIVPDPDDQEWIHDKLFSEIEFNIIKQDTKDHLLEIIENLKTEQKIDSVILGCTELPLIIKPQDLDIPLINTADIHANTAVSCCLQS